MYLAYKYIKKKRNEKREQKQQKQDQQQQGHATIPAPATTASSGLTVTPAEEPPPAPLDPKVRAKKTQERDHGEETDEEQQRHKAEKRRRTIYRCKLICGLAMPFTLQGLDTTIVASALPYIAADFGQVAQLNWIISAFNLTAAAFLPFWSQIADIFGRHATIHATLVVMLVGSAICTGAPTHAFGVLLLGRALQGVGASGINICVRTILADRVSLKEYAVHWTLFALIAAVSFSIGPVIGGYLNEASWRWCFAINLPVAVVAIVLIAVLLRHDLLGPQPLPQLSSTHRGRFFARMGTLDVGGQLLFLWGLGLVILALTWAGSAYGWGSAHVLAPLVVGLALTAAWVVYEDLMAPGRLLARALPTQRPMIPWDLLRQRDIGLLFWINCSLGTAMFSNMYFMDLYFALVDGSSSSKAGLSLLYFLPGLGVGAYSAMFASNVWPRQTLPPLLLGGVTSAVGVTVLAYAVHAGRSGLVYGMMALTGHGVGIRMNPASLHGLAYFPQATAAISCIVAFAMPFGGTVTLTLMSTVFNNKGGSAGDAAQTKRAIMWAFIAVIPLVWLAVVLTTFLGNVWIRKDETHEVCLRPYLWSLLLRRPIVNEARSRVDETHSMRELCPADEENAEGR